MYTNIKSIILILILSAGVSARSIYYKLSMPEPHTHLFEIEMRLEGASGKAVVALPVWTPGSYLIREYARNVQDVSARSADGTILTIRKTDKNHWEVKGKRRQDIYISYWVYAYEHSVRTSYLNADHALVVPASVLMYWQKNTARNHFLHVKLPETWSTISTALEPFDQQGTVDFTAHNYDELVDSPLELGNQHVIQFEVLGKPHQIAIYGASNYVDSVLVADFTKIIEAEAAIFGGLPYEHYSFIIHAEEGRGGLEHAGSSVNFVNRWSFTNKKRYKGFLSIIAHEFFHTWNVKRIYPHGIATFDYDNENYLEELWVAEGFTSYYDKLILERTDVMDRTAYFEIVKDEINSLESRMGKRHQSVTAASWDAWIKYYRPNEHSRNSTISYYNKGHLLGLLLDIKIIDSTGGQANLDAVMLKLYQDFALSHKGYSTADVQQACETISGMKLNEFFQNYVSGLARLPYAEVLNLAGMALDSTTEKTAWIGAKLQNQNSRIMISRVTEDSPAWKAGLNAKDELLAIDGFRVTSADPQYLSEKVPGDRIACTLSRNGVLKDIHLTVGYKPVEIESIKPIEEPSDQQKLVFEKWLGVSWETLETD